MKKCIALIICVAVLFLGGCATVSDSQHIADDVIRIACVGDSITYGLYVSNRTVNSYPARLQEYLGDIVLVENFGKSGGAVLASSNKPYTKTQAYEESLAFLPDIVLLMLGTNDTKKKNWTDMASFSKDYRSLIQAYVELPSQPVVILLTPIYAFGKEGPHQLSFSMDLSLIHDIGLEIQVLGDDLNLEVIELFEATSSERSYYTSDGVHLNAKGAEMLALAVLEVLEPMLDNL